MRVMLIGNTTASALLTVAAVLAATPLLTAQPAPAPAWMQLTIVHVAPSMIDEYIAGQREITAHVKKSGPPWRLVSRTEVFGDAFRFVILTPVANLASFDPKNSDADLAALNRRLQKYVTS